MIAAHIPLVHRIARTMIRGKPASVEYNDLVGAGMVGLMEGPAIADAEPVVH